MEQEVRHHDRAENNEVRANTEKAGRTGIMNNFGIADFEQKGNSERPLNPSQYYVDLFYSQLAYSYFESLYHLSVRESLKNTCNYNCALGRSSISPNFDSLYYLANSGIKNILGIYSDKFQDYGPQTRLTDSVFFRDGLNQVLLGQVYDSFVEIPARCNVTTEFSLIGEYESNEKNFSYPNEKKYSINPWERYHVSILIRAIFIFVFFDVSKELYFVLISLYFLYVRGFFDGVQELFEKISSNHPMEATLADLRRRRAEVELEAAQLLESETVEVVETNLEEKNEANVDIGSEIAIDEAYNDEKKVERHMDELPDLNQENVSNDMKEKVKNDAHNPELNEGIDVSLHRKHEETSPIAHTEKENISSQEDKRTNYYFCILYQTIGMYILTLMPWWNPDPTYLI
ncbi:hypothetical protein FG379_002356 [Cryptosporidium bovis]|uniref:uncharacterized protein n=1 Tax=Cryptosporidium bovis TaxID=310047 RepID=UPI00351A3D36|nr:hypothetical protein FG379_002356 [Cryptosporidium bovis]